MRIAPLNTYNLLLQLQQKVVQKIRLRSSGSWVALPKWRCFLGLFGFVIGMAFAEAAVLRVGHFPNVTRVPVVIGQGLTRLEFTYDPVRESVTKAAADAYRLGFLRQAPDLSRLFQLDPLNSVLRELKLKEVR